LIPFGHWNPPYNGIFFLSEGKLISNKNFSSASSFPKLAVDGKLELRIATTNDTLYKTRLIYKHYKLDEDDTRRFGQVSHEYLQSVAIESIREFTSEKMRI